MPGPQLDLFGGGSGPPLVGPAEVPEAVRDLAARLPAGLHLGTSSWSFPGWAGIVWDRPASQADLARHGLSAYARHPLLNAVGVDRSFYGPLDAEAWRAYADQVPDGFRFLVKAHEALTVRRWPHHPRYGREAGQDNPLFLDPGHAAEAAIGPVVEGLGERAGPILFQFPPQAPDALGGLRGFAERLRAFFAALPAGPLYAVEVRNAELLGREYADALADYGVAHCVNVHGTMPPVLEQVERAGVLWGPALVVRWMLRRELSYEEAKARYQPFDHLVDEDPDARAAIAHLVREWAEGPAFVIANNKAEGSAPLTLLALAQEIVEGA